MAISIEGAIACHKIYDTGFGKVCRAKLLEYT